MIVCLFLVYVRLLVVFLMFLFQACIRFLEISAVSSRVGRLTSFLSALPELECQRSIPLKTPQKKPTPAEGRQKGRLKRT